MSWFLSDPCFTMWSSIYLIPHRLRTKFRAAPLMAPQIIRIKNKPAKPPGMCITKGRAKVRNSANVAAEPIPAKNKKNAGTVSSKRTQLDPGGKVNL